VLWNLLTSTVDVNAKTVTPGDYGNTVTYVTAYTNIAASVQPQDGSPSFHEDGRKIVAKWQVYLQQTVTVNPGDQIVWNGVEMYVDFLQDMIGLNRAWRLSCTQFQDGA
jgi:hypothetical protein